MLIIIADEDSLFSIISIGETSLNGEDLSHVFF